MSDTLRAPGVHCPDQVMHLDLSSLKSVRAFARAFEEKHGGQLDVLVNNGERRGFSSHFLVVVSCSVDRLVMPEMLPAWC